MAEDRGITVRWAEIHDEDCTLAMADLASKINAKTKLVAVGYASNAVGTINPVREIVKLAHAAGALAYIDAVHYGPHGLIDVAALDCGFPGVLDLQILWPALGRALRAREHLTRLRPYKVRPNTNAIPNCWEWGTLNHECIAGIAACVEYLADLGRRAIDPCGYESGGDGRLAHPSSPSRPAATATRREATRLRLSSHPRARARPATKNDRRPAQNSGAQNLRHHRSRAPQ